MVVLLSTMLHGLNAQRVRRIREPLNNVLEMWSLLQRQRLPSRLLVWPDEHHWILKGENSRVFYQEVHQWLAIWLCVRLAVVQLGGARLLASRLARTLPPPK